MVLYGKIGHRIFVKKCQFDAGEKKRVALQYLEDISAEHRILDSIQVLQHLSHK